jgi:hypothetical protein
MLDGAAVDSSKFSPASGWKVARVQLGQGDAGNHHISGTLPFGIQVYGYGQYTSYWYPGGLDLKEITIQ